MEYFYTICSNYAHFFQKKNANSKNNLFFKFLALLPYALRVVSNLKLLLFQEKPKNLYECFSFLRVLKNRNPQQQQKQQRTLDRQQQKLKCLQIYSTSNINIRTTTQQQK